MVSWFNLVWIALLATQASSQWLKMPSMENGTNVCDDFHNSMKVKKHGRVASLFFGKSGVLVTQLGVMLEEHKAGTLELTIDNCDGTCNVVSEYVLIYQTIFRYQFSLYSSHYLSIDQILSEIYRNKGTHSYSGGQTQSSRATLTTNTMSNSPLWDTQTSTDLEPRRNAVAKYSLWPNILC